MLGKSRARTRLHGCAAWLCGLVIVGAGLSGGANGLAAGASTLTAPGTPAVIAVTAGIRSVAIAFTKPANDGGARVSNYRGVCTSGNGGLSGVHQGFSSPVTVAGLTSGKTYTCTVAAINKVGIGPASAPSQPVVTLPTVPGAPTITAMTPGFHNVSVSFKATTTGGAPITNYRVTCKDDEGVRSHQAHNSPITIGCVNGAETYTCTVAAENRIGWSRSSPTSNPAISLPVVPGAPKITSVTAGLRSISVAFAKPVNDGGVRISNYRVTCTSDNGGVTGSHQAFVSPITVAGLGAGKSYTCTVRAINKVAVGPASLPSAVVVPHG